MRKKNLYSPGMHDRFVDARGPLLRVTAQEQTDVFCPATVFPTIRQKMTTVSWQLSGGGGTMCSAVFLPTSSRTAHDENHN